MDFNQFDQEAKRNLNNLSSFLEIVIQEREASSIIEFSQEAQEELEEAVAIQLRNEEALDEEASIKKARHLTREALSELRKTSVREKICAAAKSLSNDSFAILPFLYGLIQVGTLSIPFDPTGALLVSITAIMIAKAGIESFCTENKSD